MIKPFCLALLILGSFDGINAFAAEKTPPPVATSVAPATTGALPSLGEAPAWKLKDLEGKEISSTQFKGKVVIVDFWATWCGPCVEEIPSFIKLQEKYGKDGLVVIGVSEDQIVAAKVKKFVEQHHMNYLVVMDNFDTAAAFGGTEALPTTILIDRAGVMRDRKLGLQDPAEYEQKVKSLLK